jgi:hypothetical protein
MRRNIMYYHLSVLGLLFVIYILFKVKNKLFSEVKSFFWIIGGLLVVILPIYPDIITTVARLMGIEYAPSVLFLLGIIFIIFIVFRQEQDVSNLNERVKELAQRNSLLEERLRCLEK